MKKPRPHYDLPSMFFNRTCFMFAVVHTGSSGIGRAMVEKLAKQGINKLLFSRAVLQNCSPGPFFSPKTYNCQIGVNVVIASLDDELLSNCYSDMEAAYPDRQVHT